MTSARVSMSLRTHTHTHTSMYHTHITYKFEMGKQRTIQTCQSCQAHTLLQYELVCSSPKRFIPKGPMSKEEAVYRLENLRDLRENSAATVA